MMMMILSSPRRSSDRLLSLHAKNSDPLNLMVIQWILEQLRIVIQIQKINSFLFSRRMGKLKTTLVFPFFRYRKDILSSTQHHHPHHSARSCFIRNRCKNKTTQLDIWNFHFIIKEERYIVWALRAWSVFLQRKGDKFSRGSNRMKWKCKYK